MPYGRLHAPATSGRLLGRRPGRIAEPGVDRAFHVVNYCLLGLFTLSVLYPLVYVLSSSFSSGDAIRGGQVKLFPVGFNVDAYHTIFGAQSIFIGFANSTLYAVAGAVIGR